MVLIMPIAVQKGNKTSYPNDGDQGREEHIIATNDHGGQHRLETKDEQQSKALHIRQGVNSKSMPHGSYAYSRT